MKVSEITKNLEKIFEYIYGKESSEVRKHRIDDAISTANCYSYDELNNIYINGIKTISKCKAYEKDDWRFSQEICACMGLLNSYGLDETEYDTWLKEQDTYYKAILYLLIGVISNENELKSEIAIIDKEMNDLAIDGLMKPLRNPKLVEVIKDKTIIKQFEEEKKYNNPPYFKVLGYYICFDKIIKQTADFKREISTEKKEYVNDFYNRLKETMDQCNDPKSARGKVSELSLGKR